jgi:hypothetical protein
MPKISTQKKIESFIKRRRVVEMKDLFELIGSTSRMTVFRHLREVAYLCSYSHTGRYYTHEDIPRFNMDGLWFYGDIGFSQNGSLKNTVTFLVNRSDVGRFHAELEGQLRVRVHNVLLDLVKSEQIERIKFEGQYLYLSTDKIQRDKQIRRRDRRSAQLGAVSLVSSEPMVIEVLAEVIRQSERQPRADQVVSSLAARGLAITEEDVVAVFNQYGVGKKTPDSR